MRSLVVGGLGSIGRRYQAILKHLKQDFEIYDITSSEPDLSTFTHAIIASPSEMHREHILRFAEHMPVLCEKPICLRKEDLQIIRAMKPKHLVYMVNNYSFLNTNPGFPPRVDKIEYDFYNTGRDGTAMDCIQLLFLAEKIGAELEVKKDSPVWDLWINDKLKVPYDWIEWSYVQMINAFLNGRTQHLWPLTFGIEATELAMSVQEKMEDKHAGFSWRPEPKQQQAATK
jgi:hypothetical protein